MIPEFNKKGNLPAGIYDASWNEMKERFGHNERRKDMMENLRIALYCYKSAGCKIVYIDGSFVTNKSFPNDIDCVWDTTGVKSERLDNTLKDFSSQGRKRQKVIFDSEFFPSTILVDKSNSSFLDFFQKDKETGDPKGIISLNLDGLT